MDLDLVFLIKIKTLNKIKNLKYKYYKTYMNQTKLKYFDL